MMKIQCSWCGRLIGYKDGPENETTHGICHTCKDSEKQKLDRAMISKYNAGVVDMIEDLMMFYPIPRRRT